LVNDMTHTATSGTRSNECATSNRDIIIIRGGKSVGSDAYTIAPSDLRLL
jgi:hypothetical protein